MKKIGTYFSLLVLAICCMTGISFATDTAYYNGEPMEPAPGYVMTKRSDYYDGQLYDTIEYSYQFDNKGNITSKKSVTSYPWQDSTYTSEETYTYNGMGNMLSYTTTDGTYSKNVQYDGAGNVLSTEEKGTGYEDKTQCTYDENKNLVKEESSGQQQSNRYTSTCIKTYDENNNLIQEKTSYTGYDVLFETTTTNTQVIRYTYTTDGLLETVTETNEKVTAANETVTTVNTTHYTYGFQGHILKEESISSVDGVEKTRIIESYSYNSKGELLTDQTDTYYQEVLSSESLVEYTYNEYGSITQIKDGSDTFTYEYDENQNNISLTGPGNLPGSTEQHTVCEYAKIPNYDSTPTAPFVDVQNTNDYFYTPVLWAVENNITYGTDDTHFSPNQSCTRAQLVSFLWRAAGEPEPETTKSPFTDVQNPNEYYYKAVLWAAENGIAAGVGNNQFAPNQTCTRAQIVSFIYRASGDTETYTENPFQDISPKDYYYKAVLWGAANGVVAGTSDTTFSPDETCTRAQGVSFLYRSNGLY